METNKVIGQENINLNYLYKNNFDKTLLKLIKKLNNKKVVIYGAGLFFQTIAKNFDLSGLNIAAISDMKFINHKKDETFMNFKVIAPDEIASVKPDYVLVATKYYITIIENLFYDVLKGSNIKIRPLVKKSFITMVYELFQSKN